VFLDALPLTPSGKVDRKSLPPSVKSSLDSGTSYVAPRDPIEQVVARIWGEVLKLERVSVVDNFFELGGHSLLATQVTSRIRSTLRVDLPVRRLFEGPTVERLSQAIRAAAQAPGQVERIARIVMDITAMSDQDAKDVLQKKRGQKEQKQHLDI
jgi:acyl carrier protein